MTDGRNLKRILPSDLIPLNAFEKDFPIRVHVAYADESYPHNHFKGLYHKDAKVMWAHKDFADIILLASLIAHENHGWTLELKDCFRPIEAQERMAAFGCDSMMVSLPGRGAHPRAMAIDLCVLDRAGVLIDMGTAFDFFPADPAKDNPAGRDYTRFDCSQADTEKIVDRRDALTLCLLRAASLLEKTIFPLPHEWWDYRAPLDVFSQYAPLRESDVAPYQRMIDPDLGAITHILAGMYPDGMLPVVESVRERVLLAFKTA